MKPLRHWNRHARRISLWRHLRSKIWWFAEFCNSHCLSHFAAFFIGMGTKTSIVENFCFSCCLLFSNNNCIVIIVGSYLKWHCHCDCYYYHHRMNQTIAAMSSVVRTDFIVSIIGFFYVNDPSAGSPTETLLRLLLPLSDKVYLTSRTRIEPGCSPEGFTGPLKIGRSDGRCVQRAGT